MADKSGVRSFAARAGRIGLWSANLALGAMVFFAIQSCVYVPEVGWLTDAEYSQRMWRIYHMTKQPPVASASEKATTTGSRTPVNASTATGNTPPAPGGTDFTTIQGKTSSSGKALVDALLTYTWTPPFPDLTNLVFSTPPDNPGGPSPYVWSGLSAQGGSYPEVRIDYRYPAEPVRDSGVSVGQVRYDDGSKVLNADPSLRQVDLAAGRRGGPGLTVEPSAGAADSYIQYSQYLDFGLDPAAMSDELCGLLADVAASGVLFFAVQTPTVGTGEGQAFRYTVLEDRDPAASSLELRSYSSAAHGFVGRLALAPQYVNALEKAYPSPAGMAWSALAVRFPFDKRNCTGFPAGTNWTVLLHLLFDTAVDNRSFASYYCYAGESPFVQAALRGVARQSGLPTRTVSLRDGPCITCVGPTQASLQAASNMTLLESWYDLDVQPDGNRVAFNHFVLNATETCDLTVNYVQAPPSPLGWGFYGETGGHYDLAKPITSIGAGAFTSVWLVSAPVTTAAAPGDYSVTLTVAPRSGGPALWTSDSVWVFPLHGDVNDDKTVNALDYALLANYLADNVFLPRSALLAADFNQDNAVDAMDAALLRRALLSR